MFGKCFLGFAVLAGLIGGASSDAATLFETTEVVADSSSQSLLTEPVSFAVTSPGNYTITLRDLQTPVSLGSLKAMVTRDLSIAGQVEVIYPMGGVSPTPASASFDVTPGTYRLHVVGTARTGQAGGAYGVSITAAGGGAAVVEKAGSIAATSAPVSGESVLQTKFQITQPGMYQLALTDQGFPAALASTQMLLLDETSVTPVVALTAPGGFTAAAGTYELIVIAKAADAAKAGLYSVAVANASTLATVYASTQPVGRLLPAALLTIPGAGQFTFTLADAMFPAALNSLSAVVVQQNAVVHSRTAAGEATLTLAQGDLQVYVQATPSTVAGVGASKLRLAQGSSIVDARTLIADASPDPGTPAIYSFSSRSPVAAGMRRLTLKDFAFPQALSSIKATIVQGDTVSEIKEGSGTLDATLRAEPVSVLVAATPAAGTTSALFGISLATQPMGAIDIESTQGVGDLFKSHTVQVTTAGRYDLTLADLQFPASLRSAALAITRGTTLVGQVFGSGTIPAQQLDTGTYVLNFLGQPATASSFGSYGLKVADAPAAAAITFTASPTSLQPGQKASLQWSATNATTCTASNGWSGVRAVSGTMETEALQTTTTFDLTCSGAGGSTTVSTTVNVVAAKKGGGGGSMDALLLACLAGAIGIVAVVRRRRSDHTDARGLMILK